MRQDIDQTPFGQEQRATDQRPARNGTTTRQSPPIARHDARQAATDGEIQTGRAALVTSLWGRIRYLQRELDVCNEELHRKDRLLAAVLERVLELETSPEAREPSRRAPRARA